MASVALLLLVAALSYLLFRSLRQYNGLKAFGGHWAAGWTRLWLYTTVSSGKMNIYFTEVNDKYGM